MRFLRIKRYKFAYDFYDNRSIYPFYKKITNKTNGEIYVNNKTEINNDLKHAIHIVTLINPYYQIGMNDSKPIFKALRFDQHKGFMAQLTEFKSVEQYMLAKMSSKSRTKIRGYIRRLETCFTISYKMYYGEISKIDYDFLFKNFRTFLSKRFEQRGDDHEAFSRWDTIQNAAYKMILNKTASLFVIYNEDRPIDICLNYHHQNIIDNAIRSYDIDYSKFRLGYIDIYKQLEWCFGNGVEIFDLSIGDFDYKRKWCNVEYDFENHIIFDRNKFLKRITAHLILSIYLLKGFLKDRNLHLHFNKIKNLFILNEKPKGNLENVSTEIEVLNQFPKMEGITVIDFLDEKYIHLRKTIYDFQYNNSEHSKNLSVFKMNNHNTIFLVKGLNNTIKIIQKST